MDLTDLNLTSTPPTFSPGSTLLANSVSTRLIIRSASSLSLVKTFLIPPIPGPTPTSSPYPAPEITSLSFSPNTTRLLAFCARAGTAFVFSLEDEGGEDDGVEAMLEGGVEGLVKVEWARVGKGREGKVILAWSELGLRLTIWDLDKPNSRTYIQNFKNLVKGHTYSSTTDHFYLAERHGGRDYVGVYNVRENWTQLARIPTPTINLTGIALSPQGTYLSVWDHSLEYKLSIHLPPLTKPLATFPPSSTFLSPLPSSVPSPSSYRSSSASMTRQLYSLPTDIWKDTGLGVRCVAWRPGGKMLAVGGWDGRVILLESVGWSVESVIEPIRTAGAGMNVWKESQEWQKETRGRGIVQYQTCLTPCTIPYTPSDPKKPPPKIGVSQLEWNVDGTLLLVRQENSPSSLFIHPFRLPPTSSSAQPNNLEPSLSASSSPTCPASLPTILLQTHPIHTALFHPSQPEKLALLTTRPNALFTWSGDWLPDSSSQPPTPSSSSHIPPPSPFRKESPAHDGGEAEMEGLAECISMPTGDEIFAATWAKWGPDGEGLCVAELPAGGVGYGKFLMVFEVGDEEADDEWGAGGKRGREERGDLTLEESLTLEGMSLIQEEEEEEEEESYSTA